MIALRALDATRACKIHECFHRRAESEAERDDAREDEAVQRLG